MAKLDFDAAAHDLIRRAELDPAAALEVLAYAAQLLRQRADLLPPLSDYLATAFDLAANEGAHALLRGLRLEYGRRRPAADWVEVGRFLDGFAGTRAEAVAAAAKRFKIGQRTVRDYRKTFEDARAAHNAADSTHS